MLAVELELGSLRVIGARRDHSIIAFLGLTFAWTYLFHAAVILWNLEPRGLVYAVGLAGPTLVAVLLVHRSDESLGRFLRRGVQWNLSPLWYAVALSPAIIRLVGFFVYSASNGSPALPSFRDVALGQLVVVFFFAALCEEFGWRGYALPRLQQRFGSARMGLVLGTVWALWHIPHFLMPGSSQAGSAFELFWLDLISQSLILALLYNRTRGSIFIAMVHHGVDNVSANLIAVPEAAAGYVLGVSCIAASATLPFLPRPLFRVRAR